MWQKNVQIDDAGVTTACKSSDAINQLSSDMADFPFNEEVTRIKNI